MEVTLKLKVNGIELELTQQDARELGEKLLELTGGKTVEFSPVYVQRPLWEWPNDRNDRIWTSSSGTAKLFQQKVNDE